MKISSGTRTAALCLCAALGLVAPGQAAEVALSAPGTDGWKALRFRTIERQTIYTAERIDDLDAVRAVSECAASALYLAAGNIDLAQTPRLHWRWKIEHGLQIGNERTKAGDDFAARVYVMFQFDATHASLWERLQHTLGTRLYGDPIPGNTLNYVWASNQPRGTRWTSPYTGSSKLVSLGDGPLPQWKEEVVDIAADYRSMFGQAPPPLLAIALMSDSDNSCQRAVADFAAFRFSSATGGPP